MSLISTNAASHFRAKTGQRGPFLTRLHRLATLWQSRRALSQLDPDQLEDIGVTSTEAKAEAARPFWDVPQHWLK